MILLKLVGGTNTPITGCGYGCGFNGLTNGILLPTPLVSQSLV